MQAFEIVINDKKYEYISTKKIDDKDYIMYADDNNIYINEYKIDNNNLVLTPLDNDLFSKLKEVFDNE